MSVKQRNHPGVTNSHGLSCVQTVAMTTATTVKTVVIMYPTASLPETAGLPETKVTR